uniref:Uncharacterized LOC115439269 n=1 Tax=Sphaeramia orbicularis TaxID=375764 RepID=A0A673A4L7_9TELE
MASLTLVLHLLVLLSSASAWYYRSYYRYYGSSLTFTSKGQTSNGKYKVELRNQQTHYYCYRAGYTCFSGDCGSVTQSSTASIPSNSYGIRSCQYEVLVKRNLYSNRPFEIRYPSYIYFYYGYGYWVNNIRSNMAKWSVLGHVDLGTRSDTGESNRSPIFTMPPIIRVTRNCPRSFNMSLFDPDGDHVRCRVPTNRSSHECGLCGLTNGLSLDPNSCSLRYTSTGRTGNHPVELVVEDFPNRDITLSYSDGYYTSKHPLSHRARKRRQTVLTTNAAVASTPMAVMTTATTARTNAVSISTTTTAAPINAIYTPTTTTAAPPTTTAAPINAIYIPTTTTAAPLTTTAAPINAIYTPTTTTAALTNTTAAPINAINTPTTTTAAPPTTTEAPINAIYTPTTTTAAPPTTTEAPINTIYTPTTTTAAPPTTTEAPINAIYTPTTTTAALTNTTAAPINAINTPTTTTAALTNATTTRVNPTGAPMTPTTTTITRSRYISSIAPLSKLPLQFTIYVDSHYAPSCVDGDYFPIFLAPTPRNGVNLPAWINQTLEVKVISTARYTTIYNLIVTGPKGISKVKTSTDEYTIKWTPTLDEVDDHFPICFVSEARDRYHRIYHSEPRCVTVDVGHQEATVTCNETTIMVEVLKSYLIRRNEHNLHLNDYTDPSCNLSTLSNNTHVVAVMSLSSCGTKVEEDDENIIYKNDITSADPNEIISRKHDVDIAIFCAYPKRTNLTLGFRHKNPYAFSEKGFGAFTFRFEFFESQRFRTQVDASSYPVEVYLKQMIFMQIEATTSIPNTELFVESCRATPYDNSNSRIKYTIIENGCVKDKTVEIYPSSRTQFRFGMEAFEFIGAHEEVYITCSVLLCETGVAGTRCSRGCIQSGNHRSRREAAAESSHHSISQGPLHLIKPSDSKVNGPSFNLGLNVVFIVGCLVAVTVVIYRSKRSRAKYQRLPTSDVE